MAAGILHESMLAHVLPGELGDGRDIRDDSALQDEWMLIIGRGRLNT